MTLHFLLAEASAAQVGDAVVLGGAEAHHAAAVRRVRPGEILSVGDGRGTWLEGECETVSAREVVVRVTSRTHVAAPRPRIVLVQALAKGDRDELAIQAATELGVDEIIPWQAARSVSRWDSVKAAKGRARWSSIVREAAKQAHRAWIPEVGALVTTSALTESAVDSRLVVLEPSASDRLTDLGLSDSDPRDVVLVVGPEGGIAEDELSALLAAGGRAARLGETVLRTSTAGPAALALVSAGLHRW